MECNKSQTHTCLMSKITKFPTELPPTSDKIALHQLFGGRGVRISRSINGSLLKHLHGVVLANCSKRNCITRTTPPKEGSSAVIFMFIATNYHLQYLSLQMYCTCILLATVQLIYHYLLNKYAFEQKTTDLVHSNRLFLTANKR